MVDDKNRKLADLFKVFSDETRIRIIGELFNGEKCIGEIANDLNLSQSLVSHQVNILKVNNLVNYRKDGKKVFYFLTDEHVSLLYKLALEHIEE